MVFFKVLAILLKIKEEDGTLFTRGSGKKESNMDKALTITKEGHITQVSGKRTERKVLEKLIWLVDNMKVSGWETKDMVKVN